MALPYELRALESALHVAVAALEADTLDLEHSIGSSLDNLDQRVQPKYLAFHCSVCLFLLHFWCLCVLTQLPVRCMLRRIIFRQQPGKNKSQCCEGGSVLVT